MQFFQLRDYQPTSPEGFTKRVFRQSPRGLGFTLTFQPGQTLPSHSHGESDLIVTVLQGTGEATVDGRKQPIGPGGLLWCEGREMFSVENTGDAALSLLVVLCPGEAKFATNVR